MECAHFIVASNAKFVVPYCSMQTQVYSGDAKSVQSSCHWHDCVAEIISMANTRTWQGCKEYHLDSTAVQTTTKLMLWVFDMDVLTVPQHSEYTNRKAYRYFLGTVTVSVESNGLCSCLSASVNRELSQYIWYKYLLETIWASHIWLSGSVSGFGAWDRQFKTWERQFCFASHAANKGSIPALTLETPVRFSSLLNNLAGLKGCKQCKPGRKSWLWLL